MTIPVQFDAIWTVIPVLTMATAITVFAFERKRSSEWPRILLFLAVCLLFPILGFVGWAIFRGIESNERSTRE